MVSSADLSSLRISRDIEAGGSRRTLYIITGIVLLLGAIAVSAFVATSARAVQVSVAVAELRGGGGAGGLTANGYVVARTKASVSSKLAGRLAYLGVEEGDRVVEGAVLARL